MKRIALMAIAVALMIGAGFVAPVAGDKNEESKLTTIAEVPGTDELKTKDGVGEGHKSPLDVVKKAIAAAQADELAKLKTCFDPQTADSLENDSWDSGDDKLTNLQHVGRLLKAYNLDALNPLAQNTVGNYAVVVCKNGDKVNILKTVRKEPKEADVSGGKKTRNWYLADYTPRLYRIDYNVSDVKSIREAIKGGDVVKMKEYLDDWQTKTLDLLADVEEGVDPYAILLKRLQKIINNADAPQILVSRHTASIAYWFSSETADTFLIVKFDEDYNWKDETRSTVASIDLEATARFHKSSGDEYRNFVNNWE